ncbi:MAG TPA: hypothetical protein VK453_24765 [Micromonosporaceae bacterium]|nr:hypothetical protein [Micromonosporaceae bacterium]
MSEHSKAERQAVPTFDLGSETITGIGEAGQDLLPGSDQEPDGPTEDDRWRERDTSGDDTTPMPTNP